MQVQKAAIALLKLLQVRRPQKIVRRIHMLLQILRTFSASEDHESH